MPEKTKDSASNVMSMPRPKALIDEYQVLKGQRSNFESYWQTLHDYFYIEAQNVSKTYYPGSELSTDYLWDSTTLEVADVLASGFMNYLTPPTSKWFALSAKNPALKENKRIATFLEDVVDQVNYTLNKSNFYNQIISNYKSSGVYGTSCMMVEEDVDDDVRFKSLPIKNICLVEDSRGVVTGYFLEFEFTAQQAAGKFGEEKLSDKIKEELSRDVPRHEKHQFLLYIAERYVRDVRKSDKENMPVEALWLDVDGKCLVDEGGYHEMPAMCHRFDKRPFIPWGFSPAMKALPFARILNAAAKTNLRAMMKATDPAVAVPDNAFLMPFNANPRAVNYYNKNKMAGGSKDIFTFGNFGDPNAGLNAVEYYASKVRTLMYYDTFLAFNQITKQMNNPEIQERISEKMSMLGPAVGRYIAEMLNPIIIRTIGILFRKGKLPDPPAEFLMDPNYEIDLVSQLAQAQRRSELNSLITGLDIVGGMAQLNPNVLDKVDMDKVVDTTWEVIGAPMKVLREEEELDMIREQKAAEAQAEREVAFAQAAAQSTKEGSQADLNLAKAAEARK